MSTSNLHGYATFQEFLDNVQYSRTGILAYERIFGRTYVSTGGEATTVEFCSNLPLSDKSVVLDVGCGIGGGAFFLANKYGCKVKGLDLSKNMISIGQERLAEINLGDSVTLELQDCTSVKFAEGTFDMVYSRDTILHIEDKKSLYSNFCRWLKPGGTLLVTDYCSSPKPWSPDYAAYVEQRGYHLLTVQDYGQLLTDVGFVQVEAVDKTDEFMKALQDELDRIRADKDSFVKDLGQELFDYIVDGWERKVERSANNGNQRWGYFFAKKPQ